MIACFVCFKLVPPFDTDYVLLYSTIECSLLFLLGQNNGGRSLNEKIIINYYIHNLITGFNGKSFQI